MDTNLKALVEAAKKAISAMESESWQWQGEGYQGGYSDDEIAALKLALKPYEAVPTKI